MTEKHQFKDKGVDLTGQCLCENCIHEYNSKLEKNNEAEKTESNLREEQLTIFDMEVFKNGMARN